MGLVKHIVHSILEGCKEGICDIKMLYIKHYWLENATIVGDIEKTKKKIKTTNLDRVRKWWDEIGKLLNVQKFNIIINIMALNFEEAKILDNSML